VNRWDSRNRPPGRRRGRERRRCSRIRDAAPPAGRRRRSSVAAIRGSRTADSGGEGRHALIGRRIRVRLPQLVDLLAKPRDLARLRALLAFFDRGRSHGEAPMAPTQAGRPGSWRFVDRRRIGRAAAALVALGAPSSARWRSASSRAAARPSRRAAGKSPAPGSRGACEVPAGKRPGLAAGHHRPTRDRRKSPVAASPTKSRISVAAGNARRCTRDGLTLHG
jgi:hypothetical protein